MISFRAPVALALLLTSAFAGCAADPEALANVDATDAAAADAAAPSAGTASDPGERPTWKHGDWFEFEVVFDNTYVAFETRDRVVVNRADETGYQLGAGNRDLGVIDTHFDDFFVGSIDADLNAKLGEDEQQYTMFQWPLGAGTTWQSALPTDPFTDQTDDITFTATPIAKVKDPRGDGPGFAIDGVSTLGYTFHFVYSARIKWITEFTKTAPDGRHALALTLKDAGSSYEGVFHLVTKKTLFERTIIWPFFVFVPEFAPVPPADTLTISEEFTFVQEIV
ncbi:MAG TPA: hypothetical protein VGB18_05255, partial [Candidatus Thermoplasmatota archaeon]